MKVGFPSIKYHNISICYQLLKYAYLKGTPILSCISLMTVKATEAYEVHLFFVSVQDLSQTMTQV